MKVFAIDQIVSQRQEEASTLKLAELTFEQAYDALRRQCPKGDLHMRLWIEGESDGTAPEVGRQ